MFEDLFDKEVVVYIKNQKINGIVLDEYDGFLKIKENDFFDINYIKIKSIDIIRCIFDEPQDHSSNYIPQPPDDSKPTNRIAAVVGKRKNDFSMNIPQEGQSSYKYPQFVRNSRDKQ